MKTDFKLIALDMDGTLLDDNSDFSNKLALKLKELKERDICVVFATGRTYKSAENVMKRMRISAPVIASNGSKVVLPETGELYNKKIPLNDARTIFNFVNKKALHSVAFVGSVMHVEKPDKHLIQFAKDHGIGCKVIGNLAENLAEDVNLIFSIYSEPVKINFNEVLNGTKVSITQSIPNSYEFMAEGCNKGRALHVLANHLGVRQDEILAVGNALNDLEMLEFAGKGIAMKNSDPGLLKLWDNVSEFTNNEEGVYEIISQIM